MSVYNMHNLTRYCFIPVDGPVILYEYFNCEKLSEHLNLINEVRPPIFWQEKPMIKKQLSVWSLVDLKKIIGEINDTELLCKKNPQISKVIFFNFFSEICKKANNFS